MWNTPQLPGPSALAVRFLGYMQQATCSDCGVPNSLKDSHSFLVSFKEVNMIILLCFIDISCIEQMTIESAERQSPGECERS